MSRKRNVTRGDVQAMAESFGAKLDNGGGERIDGDFDRLYIDLPGGKHWVANDTNQLDYDYKSQSKSERTAAYAQAMDDMGRGVEDCPHGGCDECEGDVEESI